MAIFDFIFGSIKKKTNTFITNGALVLDVRTVREFEQGHIKNSINIPVGELKMRIDEVKHLNKPVIACCQSGIRSAKAAYILSNNGIECINGGGWQSLEKKHNTKNKRIN